MFTSSLLHGAKEEVAMAREFPLREKPFRELLIKKSHQIPQLLSLSQGDGRPASRLDLTGQNRSDRLLQSFFSTRFPGKASN